MHDLLPWTRGARRYRRPHIHSVEWESSDAVPFMLPGETLQARWQPVRDVDQPVPVRSHKSTRDHRWSPKYCMRPHATLERCFLDTSERPIEATILGVAAIVTKQNENGAIAMSKCIEYIERPTKHLIGLPTQPAIQLARRAETPRGGALVYVFYRKIGRLPDVSGYAVGLLRVLVVVHRCVRILHGVVEKEASVGRGVLPIVRNVGTEPECVVSEHLFSLGLHQINGVHACIELGG